jgi:CelD/BcsL family acetyltransferase involved in cellulose biosynthesis
VGTIRTIRIGSLDELHRRAADWDDLWDRSGLELPLLRAEMLAAWVEQFSRPRRFQALAVESDGRLVAALPLVLRRIKGVLSVLSLPANEWSMHGDLLWDATAGDDVTAALAGAVASQGSLLWLDGVQVHSPRWRALCDELARAKVPFDLREHYPVGLIEVDRDFERFASRLSSNFRRNTRRRLRNLEKRGGAVLRHESNLTPDGVECALREAFEIERQSWKGGEGTAVLQAPGVAEFFIRQCQSAARRTELYVDFLDVAGRPVAFEFGYVSKGRQFAHKISYLDEFAAEAPGHVLRWLQLERLAAADEVYLIDYFGKMSEAAEKWSSSAYSVGRLIIGSRRLVGRLAFSAYRWLAPLYRRWRDRKQAKASLAAAAFAHAGDHADKTRLAHEPADEAPSR